MLRRAPATNERPTLEALRAPSSAKASPKKAARMSIGSIVATAVAMSLLLSSPFLYLLLTRLGMGSPFPDQPFLKSATAVLPSSVLEVAIELPMPPGNVAVSAKGRVFFNYHPEYNPPVKVLEMSSRSVKTFPSDEFQRQLVTVLSLRVDSKDRLWLLDYANHGMAGAPRLFGFDLRAKDAMMCNYSFPPEVAGFGSMLNDFQVDPRGELMYIVDTSLIGGTPALVVFDTIKRSSFRLLDGHSSMWGASHFLSVGNHTVRFGPLGLRINVDSVALDRTGQFLYFGALTGDKLFAAPVAALQDEVKRLRAFNRSQDASDPAAQELGTAVRVVLADKPVTDGLTIDAAGNIWMTAVEHSALVLAVPFKAKNAPVHLPPTFTLVKAVQSDTLLRWPDGFSFGPDGLYVSCSALHMHLAGANMTVGAPYHILRMPTRQLKNKDLYRGRSFASTTSGH